MDDKRPEEARSTSWKQAFWKIRQARKAPQRDPVSPVWPPGTLGWLAVRYSGSDEFLALDARSQRIRRGVIESCLAETSIAKDGKPAGFCPLHLLTSQTVKTLRGSFYVAPHPLNSPVLVPCGDVFDPSQPRTLLQCP